MQRSVFRHHRIQVVAHDGELAAAECIVAAELDDDHGGFVLRKQL